MDKWIKGANFSPVYTCMIVLIFLNPSLSNNVFLLEIDGGIKCSEFNSELVRA